MASAVATKIVEKGIDNVDLSMLNEKMRVSILNEAADILINKGRHDEAVKALAKSGSREKALDIARWLEERHFFKHAALAYIISQDKDKISEIASVCINNSMYLTAKLCYDALGDIDMMKFVDENFPHTDQ